MATASLSLSKKSRCQNVTIFPLSCVKCAISRARTWPLLAVGCWLYLSNAFTSIYANPSSNAINFDCVCNEIERDKQLTEQKLSNGAVNLRKIVAGISMAQPYHANAWKCTLETMKVVRRTTNVSHRVRDKTLSSSPLNDAVDSDLSIDPRIYSCIIVSNIRTLARVQCQLIYSATIILAIAFEELSQNGKTRRRSSGATERVQRAKPRKQKQKKMENKRKKCERKSLPKQYQEITIRIWWIALNVNRARRDGAHT